MLLLPWCGFHIFLISLNTTHTKCSSVLKYNVFLIPARTLVEWNTCKKQYRVTWHHIGAVYLLWAGRLRNSRVQPSTIVFNCGACTLSDEIIMGSCVPAFVCIPLTCHALLMVKICVLIWIIIFDLFHVSLLESSQRSTGWRGARISKEKSKDACREWKKLLSRGEV